MAKIAFWSSGVTDACTFYRCAEPARVLAARGHDTVCEYSMGLGTAMEADVLVIQRPTEVGPRSVMEKLLALPERSRPRIVAELDDDLLGIPEHHPAHPMMQDEARRHRLDWAIRHADRVTVTNAHLAQRIAGDSCPPEIRGEMVRVVPNYVPERFVVDAVPEPDGCPVITWAGSDTHRRDFDEVAIPLRKLLRERDDFQVRVVGAPYAARLRSALPRNGIYRVGSERIAQVPWTEGVDGYIGTLTGHIGLAPLADDLFNRSKSDLRLKELAARGFAVMASDVGPYLDSAVPRFRPDITEGWHTALRTVLNNPGPRGALARDALEWAQRNTLEAHAAEWEAALLD